MMLLNNTADGLIENAKALMPQLEGRAKALAERALKRIADCIQMWSLAIASGDEESQRIAAARLEIVADTIADLQAVVDIKFMPTVLGEAGKAVTKSLTAVASQAFDVATRAAVDALVSRLAERFPG